MFREPPSGVCAQFRLATTATPTAHQIQSLRDILYRTDLSVLSVVRMARQDFESGCYAAAIARLRVDADKLRTYGVSFQDNFPLWD